MPVERIPLVGSFTSRDGTNALLFSSSQKDQFFEDCTFIVTRNVVSGKTEVKVAPRSLFVESDSPSGASGDGTACRLWRGSSNAIITAFGSTNSTLYNGDTSLGSITGQCVHISETMVSAVPTLLFISASNSAWYYTSGGSLTEITDTDFPPKQGTPLTITGNFAAMDGYIFIMCTNGQIWHSNVNSVSGWSSSASITAQEYPDEGMAVERYRNFIVAFSRFSIEFFQNAGNTAGATLSRVQNMARQIGLVNQHSVRTIGDTIAFIGATRETIGVYVIEDGSPKNISTTAIEEWIHAAVIADGFTAANLRLHVLADKNKTYLAIATAENTTKLQVFDMETGIWHPWALEYEIRQSDASGGSSRYVGEQSAEVLKNFGGGPAAALIQTAPIDFGTKKRKTLNCVRVIGDEATSGTVSLSWSDDDGKTWSTGRSVDMSGDDPKLNRCGVFRKRAFRVSGISTADTGRSQLLAALEMEYEVGTV